MSAPRHVTSGGNRPTAPAPSQHSSSSSSTYSSSSNNRTRSVAGMPPAGSGPVHSTASYTTPAAAAATGVSNGSSPRAAAAAASATMTPISRDNYHGVSSNTSACATPLPPRPPTSTSSTTTIPLPPHPKPPPASSMEPELGDASEVESYSTVYHKLTRLCGEIETAIYSAKCAMPSTYTSTSATTTSHTTCPIATANTSANAVVVASDTRKAIGRIRVESFAQTSPEAEFATRLFHYYTRECVQHVSSTCTSTYSSGVASSDGIDVCSHIPAVLYTGRADQVHGLKGTLASPMFYMRGLVLLLSVVVVTSMAVVPTIGEREVHPIDMVQVEIFII